MLNFPSPTNFFDKLWDVKKVVHRKAFIYTSRKEEAFSKVREKMKMKFIASGSAPRWNYSLQMSD